jgi:hypothetical protein
MTIEQQIAQQYLPPGGVKDQTSFTDLIPIDTVVNKNLLNQFANSQTDPEINRLKSTGMNDFFKGLASTGGYRFGTGRQREGALSDNFERQRKEMANQFFTSGADNLTNYYNELMNEYYRDPNAFEFDPLSINQKLGYTPPVAPTAPVDPATLPSTQPVQQQNLQPQIGRGMPGGDPRLRNTQPQIGRGMPGGDPRSPFVPEPQIGRGIPGQPPNRYPTQWQRGSRGWMPRQGNYGTAQPIYPNYPRLNQNQNNMGVAY